VRISKSYLKEFFQYWIAANWIYGGIICAIQLSPKSGMIYDPIWWTWYYDYVKGTLLFAQSLKNKKKSVDPTMEQVRKTLGYHSGYFPLFRLRFLVHCLFCVSEEAGQWWW